MTHLFKIPFIAMLFLLALCSVACTRSGTNYSWENIKKRQYCLKPPSCQTSDFYLLILVTARHLDYTSTANLLKTMCKHPSDGSKNGDVGHAWIELHGIENGEFCVLEGGHSGERGINQEKYLDGIMNYIDFGYANPSPYQKCHPCFEPNPAKYLWEAQCDGYFEKGSGGHIPTFAIKVDITPSQYDSIKEFILYYDYQSYSFTGNQCSSFVTQAASIGGLQLDSLIEIPVAQFIKIGGECLQLWEDPFFAKISIHSPDVLEKNMIRSVEDGRAAYALHFYKKTHRTTWKQRYSKMRNNLIMFPERIEKILFIQNCR